MTFSDAKRHAKFYGMNLSYDFADKMYSVQQGNSIHHCPDFDTMMDVIHVLSDIEAQNRSQARRDNAGISMS